MKKQLIGLISLVGCVLSGCQGSSKTNAIVPTETGKELVHEEIKNHHLEDQYHEENYADGVLLVKDEKEALSKQSIDGIKSFERLYNGSSWYKVELESDLDTSLMKSNLLELDLFEKVDFDYLMSGDGEVESIDISSNPWSGDEKHLDNQGIKEAWKYLKKEGKNPGGSSDVIVAVIDTGVDYNHIDLRNNIWTNSAEIPYNGIDDDGNGYIDDYYGWDCVGNDNDPMDDNGHGTHVAGIIAAENNSEGIVGIAFNCKIMCIKAGNSSGYFNNSDIAEAIQYAYMNGASIINMSFGGSSISTAVEDALEDAYNQCVLVAAAGNNMQCNNLMHVLIHDVGVSYPAALPYVIGVMSTNANGSTVSNFSNYDDTPFDNIEYEVYACGEQIPSTWPNNKIAKLSGTSMAAPVVSGLAALLRSNYRDRDIYSNKFIQSQIVNTGTIHPYNNIIKSVDVSHSFANVYEAITKTPTPSVNLYNYYIFDDANISNKNNGNGIIEAGETIRLAIEVYNRGGVATNFKAKIDTIRNDDEQLQDPYVTFIIDSINLQDIGTYSIRNCGNLYDGSELIGANTYFEMIISDDCPNDYIIDFNLEFKYNNGLDPLDKNQYITLSDLSLSVMSGMSLPSSFEQDTTFENDKIYILTENVIIPEGITITFNPGCTIYFFSGGNIGKYKDYFEDPSFIVYGNLVFNGTADKKITIGPSELYSNFTATFKAQNNGSVQFNYCVINQINLIASDLNKNNIIINYCDVQVGNRYDLYNSHFVNGTADFLIPKFHVRDLKNSYVQFNNYSFSNLWNASNNYLDLLTCGQPITICSGFGNGKFINNYVSSSSYYGYHNNSQIEFVNPTICENNVFDTYTDSNKDCFKIIFADSQSNVSTSNNTFRGAYYYYFQQVVDYFDEKGNSYIDKDGAADFDKVNAFIDDISIYNKNLDKVSDVEKDTYKIVVTFSKDVVSNNFKLYFGSVFPYTDFKIEGNFIDSKTWEGNYTFKSIIDNGTQYFSIGDSKVCGENDCLYVKKIPIHKFNFNITDTGSQSMNLQASTEDSGILLTWVQDDYDTLMGYNIYRSNEKDGNYVKLNSSVIPENEHIFVDENAEPGKIYWYTFTVVFSDMTESVPAGKISCAAADTIVPNIYHTPVNQGYLNNNLVISCTASDNIGVQDVTLYYRAKGYNTWKSLEMLKQNDKYSATIFGSELTLDGIEYYIVVSDGNNAISKGSAENPYSIIIKDASSISKIGDVDGDGVVTTKDALMIMQAINGDLLLTDDQFKRADLNKDKILSSVEALRILQYINGNVSTLEM